MPTRVCPPILVVCAALFPFGLARADSPEALVATIKSVGANGKGNVEAAGALRELAGHGPAVLPVILRGFDDAGPIAVNWLRNAVETIADRELRRGGKLPAAELEKFILNRERNPRARRLAFEWLRKADRATAERLVAGMLQDPSAELRRDAVQRLIDEAAAIDRKANLKKAADVYRKALSGAVDNDQVKAIVAALKELGETVDLQKHFGFITHWRIIGPFDHRGGKGFDAVYPPEKEFDLDATYKGQLGDVRWQPISTDHPYGIVNIAKQLDNYKGSCMYLAAEFDSRNKRPVELRLGTPNSWKVWVNDEFLFGRVEYHRGMKMDQYRVAARLKPGRNLILLKICQNEQDEDWAQRYEFQLRVCDGAGSAILSGEENQP